MHLMLARAATRYAASRRGRSRVLLAGIIGGTVVMAILIALASIPFVVAAMFSGEDADAAPPAPGCPIDPNGSAGSSDTGDGAAAAAAEIDDLVPEQLTNAQIIVEQGQSARVPAYGWIIALATALQESGLRNLDYGDRDSLGLFQQRPSSGWGTPEQIMDPQFSARAFYGGATSPHWDDAHQRAEPPGLLDIEGWESMTVTGAAQAVQRSAYPDAYAKWEPLARQIVGDITGDPGVEPCGDGEAMMCEPSGLPVEDGLTPDALRVIRCLYENFPAIESFGGIGDRPSNPESDHPSGRAVDAMIAEWDTEDGNQFGWTVAEWVRTYAAELGVTYVIFDAQIWSADSSEWRPYEHPSGATDPTSLHRDHVHISVHGDSAGGDDDGLGTVSLPMHEGSYTISARYGQCGGNWANCHTGLDFAAPSGFPVLAVANGTVARYENTRGAFGRLLVIDHGDGWESWYAHLNLLTGPGLSVGDSVGAGQHVAAVGSTGNSTGPHLHLEIRQNGEPIDPESWLRSHGVDP